MAYSVVIGRNERDQKDYGDLATTLIGKQYITMGNIVSMGNNIMLDALRPHVVLIAGKRGSGKDSGKLIREMRNGREGRLS